MAPDREVVVRRCRPGDLAAVVELLARGALSPGTGIDSGDPADLGPYLAALEEIEATPGAEVLVAELGGTVVGVCQLITFRHLQARGGRCAEIESVHVHPAHRSTGIGGVLLEEAVRHAIDLGCYRVQLTSNLARTDAHRFYERHGFVASHRGFKRPL